MLASKLGRTLSSMKFAQFRTPIGVLSRSFAAVSPKAAARVSDYDTEEEGVFGTLEYRQFFKHPDREGRVSPWHDIPLLQPNPSSPPAAHGKVFYYVNEIPKGTREKMEVCTSEPDSPILQDTKKGQLRLFKYGDIPFNYGCIPQTWEDPNTPHPLTGYVGDNDPIDVVELSPSPLPRGAVVGMKVLGLMALIDEEETDWKVLGIATDNPLAALMHDETDLEKHLPGSVHAVREWFRMYKTADGKPENSFAFDEQLMPRALGEELVMETHDSWKALREGSVANKKNLFTGIKK
jgi:inorganic pyrophosphatase